MNAVTSVDTFLANVRALDPAADWTYYLPLLALVESHRAELRGADWPSSVSPLEAGTYQIVLLRVENDLRQLLLTVPLQSSDRAQLTLASFAGLMEGFVLKAEALSTVGDSSRVH